MHDESKPTHPAQNHAPRLYLLYHEIRPSEAAYSYVTSAEMFGRHLDLYAQLRNSGADLIPELTFDDGHISDREIASPMIVARGLTARFFITVGWTEKKSGYMKWDDLRSLHREGHTIGAHGWTHALLTHCSDRELEAELVAARSALEDKLGTPITTMSLPGGRYDRRVLEACKSAGYTEIYTSNPRAETLPLSSTIGRLNILGDMQPESISRLFAPGDKLLENLRRRYRHKEVAKKLLGDRLYAILWALTNREEAAADGDTE